MRWNWNQKKTSCSYFGYQRLATKTYFTKALGIPKINFACFVHFDKITNNELSRGTDDLLIHINC